MVNCLHLFLEVIPEFGDEPVQAVHVFPAGHKCNTVALTHIAIECCLYFIGTFPQHIEIEHSDDLIHGFPFDKRVNCFRRIDAKNIGEYQVETVPAVGESLVLSGSSRPKDRR